MSDIIEFDKENIVNTYKRFNVVLTSGHGSILVDENGKEYIDFSTGIGTNIFGICDEEWKNAVISQVNKIQHTSNLYYWDYLRDFDSLHYEHIVRDCCL